MSKGYLWVFSIDLPIITIREVLQSDEHISSVTTAFESRVPDQDDSGAHV